MHETKKLASFLSGLEYHDLTKEVVERTKDLILDQIGVALAASSKPWSLKVYDYVKGFGGQRESTILNYGDKVKAENAAFANGSFGHGFEMDDTYLPGNTHPGAVVIPAALALGEREGVDGKRFLVAIIIGYETMGRVARAIAPSCGERGFHPISVSGPIGAAATVGKLLKFDDDLMLNGISVAASHSSGLMEYTQTGGSVKRMHGGMAAFGGIRAALLAHAGITGPPTILEGRSGFCRAFSDDSRPGEITSKLGKEFVVMETSIKRHCCCYQIQAPLDVTSKMVTEYGIKPKDIEEIVMGSNRLAPRQVGAILEPRSVVEAQFSAPFSVAMCVVKGSNGFRDYTEENLKDPDIMALAEKVRLEVDDEVQALYPEKRAVRMTIKLKDGTIYQQKLDGAKGTPVNPLTRKEVVIKFRDLAKEVLRSGRIEEIIKAVEGLDEVEDISPLFRLIVTERSSLYEGNQASSPTGP
jgi:2-methylcitrate dehydratase PrpD